MRITLGACRNDVFPNVKLTFSEDTATMHSQKK